MENTTNLKDISNEEWKKRLTKQQYDILRKKGTERAFSGEYWDTKDAGMYTCAACGAPLFSSDTKFDSGTGWPSFYDVADKKNIAEKDDRKFFMHRTEVLCNQCGGHLGHVFPDGPAPTGMRYCINSAALKLNKKSDTDAK